MDIEKKQSFASNGEANDAPVSNPNAERGPSNQLPRRPIQPKDEYFQVVERQQTVFGNPADFDRILKQLKQKKQKEKLAEPVTVPAPVKKKPSQLKPEQKIKEPTEQQKRKQRLLKNVEPSVKNYKALNNPNSSDSQVTRMRAELKEKTFRYLLYGMEELKELKQQQLSQEERRIAKLTSKDPYLLAKTLTTQIDIDFLKYLNNDNKQIPSKKYKNFIKNFWQNISEYSNLPLRRKILARQLTSKKMAAMIEQDFYPAHIRERILERQRSLLREAAAPQKQNYVQKGDQGEVVYESFKLFESKDEKKEQKKPKYKYMEQWSLIMLRDMLKVQQIHKMKNTLQTGLRKDIQERLINNFSKVFESVLQGK